MVFKGLSRSKYAKLSSQINGISLDFLIHAWQTYCMANSKDCLEVNEGKGALRVSYPSLLIRKPIAVKYLQWRLLSLCCVEHSVHKVANICFSKFMAYV